MRFRLQVSILFGLLLTSMFCALCLFPRINLLEIVGFRPLPYSDRSCTEKHEAYQALRDHHQEWFIYLSHHPDETIELETSLRNYGVRYQESRWEGDSPLIYIQTFASWHGTPTEGYGFAYFSGDTIKNSAFEKQVFRQMEDNIFCYYPTSTEIKE